MSQSLPSVSAVLLSYNAELFIADAVRSVLAQDYDAMEVIISDDASADRTAEITQREVDRYRGPHRVVQRQRSENSGGVSAHLNEVLRHASGDIIVFFDGDDISDPSRVRRTVEEFRRDPEIQAVYSSYRRINSRGGLLAKGQILHPPSATNTKAWFAKVDAQVPGCTLAVRRSVVESFGQLDPDIIQDVMLPFRASLLGEVAYLDEDLVNVRRRAGSLTQLPDTFDSMENFRARMLWGVDRARLQFSQRLSDLSTAMELMPDRAAEFEHLRAIIDRSMSNAESSAGLFSTSLWTRIGTYLRLLRCGAYPEYRAFHFCIVFMPRTYLRYKRLWLRRHVLGIGSTELHRGGP